MDIGKQIEYWINTAENDLQTAEILIANGKTVQGLFFCHLCIEKAIKAHVVRCTEQVPPKVHRLLYLLNLTDLTFSEDEKDLCAVLMAFQFEGRYPEYYPSSPAPLKANEYFKQTKNLLSCLKLKL
ncbi:MAG: HEPN domain-containing protein [Bacteroidetes bacterium]|nr:HEPN domain-containing protein [Bacteroidota bacterium]